jgi:hypothetical protein
MDLYLFGHQENIMSEVASLITVYLFKDVVYMFREDYETRFFSECIVVTAKDSSEVTSAIQGLIKNPRYTNLVTDSGTLTKTIARTAGVTRSAFRVEAKVVWIR